MNRPLFRFRLTSIPDEELIHLLLAILRMRQTPPAGMTISSCLFSRAHRSRLHPEKRHKGLLQNENFCPLPQDLQPPCELLNLLLNGRHGYGHDAPPDAHGFRAHGNASSWGRGV